jgi:teichuronic acid biosynthesis glycosyltransferase TuaC
MLRIAVVTSYFPTREQPYRGHSAYQTLRQLPKSAEIEVFVPFAVYPRWLTPRNFPYFRPDPTYSPLDLRTHYLEYPAIPKVSRFVNGYACSRSLFPHLTKFKPDVILGYWIYPDGYAAARIARRLDTPVVLCAIGSDLCRIPDGATLRLSRAALHAATSVITVSEELRQRALGLGVPEKRVQTVLNGCDTSIFGRGDRARARAELGLASDAQVVLYTGRLDAAKGLRELLAAVRDLVPEHPRVELVFVGEGLFHEELTRRANETGLSDRVRVPGPCNSAGVARWMTAADVFCLPSYSEGCPNVLIEALASGLPVVASRVGGIPELINEQCGILVPPRDAQQLAVALHTALSRRWDCNAIARQFQRGWDEVARETYEVCLNARATQSPSLT